MVDSINPATGSVLRLLWLDAGTEAAGRLLVVAHHTAVDGVSWRIIIADLIRAWQYVSAGNPVTLPPVATSMRRWARGLAEYDAAEQHPIWRRIIDAPDPPLGTRDLDPTSDFLSSTAHLEFTTSPSATDTLMRIGPALFHGNAHDALVAAVALAAADRKSVV